MQIRALTLLSAIAFFAVFALHANAQESSVTKTFLMGKHDYKRDTSFTRVAARYADKSVILKKQAYAAYLKMYAAAAKEGVILNIISATRSFAEQQSIWERKWADAQSMRNSDAKNIALTVLRWSSMPGTSRHHWGTDVDLVSLKKAFYNTPSGKKTYAWLCSNAAKFGFFQPFNAGRTEGYQEEKWHWSYLPLAKTYLKEYLRQVTYADIHGFPGSEAAVALDVIKSQVFAINPIGKSTEGSYDVAMNVPNNARKR